MDKANVCKILKIVGFILVVLLLGIVVVVYKLEHHTEVIPTQCKIVLNTENKLEKLQQSCINIPNEKKFDCFPRGIPDQNSCNLRGCCWSPIADFNKQIPSCYYPANFRSYKVTNVTKSIEGETLLLSITRQSVYPKNVKTLLVQISFETKSRLHIIIKDYENERFEPPYPQIPATKKTPETTDYIVLVDDDNFGFAVIRKYTRTVIFDTRNIGGFIFSDQLLQLSALISSKYIYGLGEQTNNFLLNTNWEEIALFNHDTTPKEHTNLYGSHPFYIAMEEGGFSHGVFLLNSNAMDIILQPAPAITYRPIGGILDFYFFLGPSPDNVIQQYTEIIGRPFLPPYWSLGFHLCRWGLKSLKDTMDLWERNRDAGIPFDVIWNDIDYMDNRNDFTISPNFTGLGDFVHQLHNIGMKYVIILDPGIASKLPSNTYPAYDEGIKQNIFIQNSSGLALEGIIWNYPKGTVFPDFTNPRTTSYWLQMLTKLYKEFQYDGLWLDMNEISNFVNGSIYGCDDNVLDNPPYLPKIHGERLNYLTLCMSAKHYIGFHYDVHNLYAFAESMVTNSALSLIRKKRPFVLSRATSPGIGHYAAHWTGDVLSTWDAMKHSVGDIISFNMFGIPMVGADICGYTGNTTKELCQRWFQLGAFYSFSRSHNSIKANDQDATAFGEEFILSTKKALEMRYRFLPYLYTLFWKANQYGESVIRPLFFEFPKDENTYTQNTQFLWGPGLLIIPVLQEKVISITSYFPQSIWFDAYTLESYESNGTYITISAPLDKIPLFLRAGYIIPYQEPSQTVEKSRKNPFGLYVTLNDTLQATGTMYWDDGDTVLSFSDQQYNLLEFNYNGTLMKSSVLTWNYETTMTLDTIYVMGLSNKFSQIFINGQNHSYFNYDSELKKLIIPNTNIDLSVPFNIMLN